MRPQVAEHLDPLAGQLAAYLLEGKEQAQVGAVVLPWGEQREDRVEDVLDRACGVALDVRQQVLGPPVFRALGVDGGVEVLLGCGFRDSRGPPGPCAPVGGRDLHALVGEPLEIEAGHAVVAGADAHIRVSRQRPFLAGRGHRPRIRVPQDAVVTHRRGNWPQRTALEPPFGTAVGCGRIAALAGRIWTSCAPASLRRCRLSPARRCGSCASSVPALLAR